MNDPPLDPRRLILMRHATAEAEQPNDIRRRLDPRGLQEAGRTGATLLRMGLMPDRVLCSSATRCQESWNVLSEALGGPTSVDVSDSLYLATSDALLESIAGVDGARTLLVLAHNPGISALAFALAGSDPHALARLRSGMTPASVAVFAVEGPWSTVSRRTARMLFTEGPDAA